MIKDDGYLYQHNVGCDIPENGTPDYPGHELVDTERIDLLNIDLKDSGFADICSEHTGRRNVVRKEYLVELAGGKCIKCGYNKELAALDFHHREGKAFTLSTAIRIFDDSAFMDLAVNEIKKCDLLCSNCHREVHAEISRRRRLMKDYMRKQ